MPRLRHGVAHHPDESDDPYFFPPDSLTWPDLMSCTVLSLDPRPDVLTAGVNGRLQLPELLGGSEVVPRRLCIRTSF